VAAGLSCWSRDVAVLFVNDLELLPSLEHSLPLLSHLESSHYVLGGVDAELGSVVFMLVVSPGVNVAYLLADLLGFMLEVLDNLDVSVHGVYLVDDVLELLACLLVDTIINRSL
jgi:hypothetical protein